MLSAGYRSDTHNIIYRGEDGKRVVCGSIEEAEAFEKKGGYSYLEIKPELQKIIHKANVFKELERPKEPSVVMALCAFSTGDGSPEILSILLKNLDVLSDYSGVFEEVTGKQLSPYARKLATIKASLNKGQGRVLEDIWASHSIRLPKTDSFGRKCNHMVHYSNLAAGSSYSCGICGASFSWKEIAPLVEEFVRLNGEISGTTPNKMSVFQALKGAVTGKR